MRQFVACNESTSPDRDARQISEALDSIKSNLTIIKWVARLIRAQSDQPTVYSDVRLILRRISEIEASIRQIDMNLP
jgi:hypothetical protein